MILGGFTPFTARAPAQAFSAGAAYTLSARSRQEQSGSAENHQDTGLAQFFWFYAPVSGILV
jgi:hypothetical protein